MQPLRGVRVLELATGVAGPYAGKLFADYGADVIKIEPVAGDESRGHGPFVDEPDPEQSALFLHLNTNKRSIVADDPTVIELAADADVVIESATPGTGIDHAQLRAVNPSVVVTSVTPFGQSGPYARYRGADIVTYAMGGPMQGTGFAGREPVKLGGNLISYQCGNLAATATLAALTMAEANGRSVHVDLSMFEAQAASMDRRVTYLLWHQWGGPTIVREGQREHQAPNGFFPTADGYALIFTQPGWVDRVVKTIGTEGIAEIYANPDWLTDDTVPDRLVAELYPWLLERDSQTVAREAQANRWPATPLNPPVRVLDDPHFVERGYFTPVEHPAAGSIRHPGAPFRLGDSWSVGPAPTLDADAGATWAQPRRERATGPEQLPLEGVRVIDFTVVWAGPSCTTHLGDLGAEIIRVDNPWVFPTATRGIMPRPPKELLVDLGPLGGSYPGIDTTEGRPWNTQGMWAAQARNKLSCTLDLRSPFGLEMFLRLAEESDVLVENNSVGVLAKLGIDWETLHARNPRLIALRMPPMGLTGPYAGYQGFGASFEALCGLTATRGYIDEDPSTLSHAFHMDPSSGATGAFAVMCALRRRAESGTGELIEFAQSENMMQHIGEFFLDADRTGREHGPGGNRHPVRAPQGCYPCAGDDKWVVISVGSDDEWTGLVNAMGRGGDDRFVTAEGRRQHHDAIDEVISSWTTGLGQYDVFAACQDQGVPAGPVLDEAGCYADPHLRATGFFRDQGNVDMGSWEFPTHQWRWDGPDMRFGPICRLGDGNQRVFEEILEVTEAEWDELRAHHLSEDYLKPDGTPW